MGASPEITVEEDAGPVDMETVELTVMDDIHSPDSPQVSRRPAKDGSSEEEEEEGDSSGSDEDRYTVYTLVLSTAAAYSVYTGSTMSALKCTKYSAQFV